MTILSLYAIGSVIIVSLISLVGLIALSIRESLLRKSIFIFVSLAVGALFGDALIHLIPEAFEKLSDPRLVSLFVIIGILTFFTLEKFLRWHHSHGDEETIPHQEKRIRPIGFLVLTSDSVHNFIDGLIIGASYLISVEVGIATTIAVILHEIPQEIGDFALLLHSGFSKAKALFVNFISALFAVFGVILILIIQQASEMFIPAVTAFAAGSFLYIAGSDLVPELHKTRSLKTSFIEFLAMLAGIGIMFALLFLE